MQKTHSLIKRIRYCSRFNFCDVVEKKVVEKSTESKSSILSQKLRGGPNEDQVQILNMVAMNNMQLSKETDFIDLLMNDIEYIPIRERITERENFVELAIMYSNVSETAIEVKQLPDRIIAIIYIAFLLEANPSKYMHADLLKMSNIIVLYQPLENETGTLKPYYRIKRIITISEMIPR